jgi:hypothetical protein
MTTHFGLIIGGKSCPANADKHLPKSRRLLAARGLSLQLRAHYVGDDPCNITATLRQRLRPPEIRYWCFHVVGLRLPPPRMTIPANVRPTRLGVEMMLHPPGEA